MALPVPLRSPARWLSRGNIYPFQIQPTSSVRYTVLQAVTLGCIFDGFEAPTVFLRNGRLLVILLWLKYATIFEKRRSIETVCDTNSSDDFEHFNNAYFYAHLSLLEEGAQHTF